MHTHIESNRKDAENDVILFEEIVIQAVERNLQVTVQRSWYQYKNKTPPWTFGLNVEIIAAANFPFEYGN